MIKVNGKFEIEPIKLNESSVYDLESYSILELYLKLAKKLNELLTEFCSLGVGVTDEIKEQNEKLNILLNNGVQEQVFNKINEMLINGDFENIINQVLFADLTSKIDDVLLQIAEVNKKVKYLTPELFGAKGDGVTDDLQAFNKMFEFMTTNADLINVGGDEKLKDFGKYNIIFTGKYAVSNTILLPSCYNLNLTGLYLTATENFMGDFLMKSTGTFRNSSFEKCIFDGNWWKASCFLIESSSLMNRIDNCQFRRFKYFGLKCGDNKGHEVVINNCKFNQYEWGDMNGGILPTTKGVGLYMSETRGDNQVLNSVFAYCLDSAIKLYASCTLINNCHVYSRNNETSYAVEIIGGFNILSNNYFDYTTVLLKGYNKVHNNIFISDKADFNFIVLDEPLENKWKYGTAQILGNTFRSSTEKIKTPIKSINFSLTKGTMSIYDNSFDNCEVVYCEPHYNYCPSPFREFPQTPLTKGYTDLGEIRLMWGTCNAGEQVTLDCSQILNVQLTLYHDTTLNNEKVYASNVFGNTFNVSGEGYVYYFAVCTI